MTRQLRRICFVTGTRAEFGLMRSALRAIQSHPDLELQLVATGMHLDRSRGRSLDAIRHDGWKVNAVIPWPNGDGSQMASAVATGNAVAEVASALARLKTDVVLVTGDRVEAFAGAAAGHLSGKLVAHVHGGDRALGLIDDSLRHAITKLAHLHFPATALSAERIRRMGEDAWRIFRTGSPGLDEIRDIAASRAELRNRFPTLTRGQFALILLHPENPQPKDQRLVAEMVLQSVQEAGLQKLVIVYPNNDPGSQGIAACWDRLKADPSRAVCRDLPRPVFLGLLRDAAILVGNSSSGIIEAASFGTPVLDLGNRQFGRERGKNVHHAAMEERAIISAAKKIWNQGQPRRFDTKNLYGINGAGRRIAARLTAIDPARFGRKLIAY